MPSLIFFPFGTEKETHYHFAKKSHSSEHFPISLQKPVFAYQEPKDWYMVNWKLTFSDRGSWCQTKGFWLSLSLEWELPQLLFYLQPLSLNETDQDSLNCVKLKIQVRIQISQLLPVSLPCEFEAISVWDNFSWQSRSEASELAFAGEQNRSGRIAKERPSQLTASAGTDKANPLAQKRVEGDIRKGLKTEQKYIYTYKNNAGVCNARMKANNTAFNHFVRSLGRSAQVTEQRYCEHRMEKKSS